MSYELIAILMFSSMMLLLITGQRVFGAIGFVAVAAAILLWGEGGSDIAFSASIKLMNWYPLLTLPLFIFMGYMLSESGIASDLYHLFHVLSGPVRGGLAIGTIGLMVAISAINGLSVAGMAIGATIALPEMLRRGYDKIMVTGVIQAGSSLGILVPPSVVLVLYGMIARQPVGQLWLAGVFPGLLLATLFVVYIAVRCHFQPKLGPPLKPEDRGIPLNEMAILLTTGIVTLSTLFFVPTFYFLGDLGGLVSAVAILAALVLAGFVAQRLRRKVDDQVYREMFRLVFVALLILTILFLMTGLFLLGVTSLVESSAVGALAATAAAVVTRRLNVKVLHDTVRKTLNVSCMFMWIILAALAFGAVFDGLGAVRAIEGFFVDQMALSPWEILIMMQISYLIMGMFLDDTAMLVIVAPLYVPLVGALGFDLIWYGVLYTITCQIAYMTPPFGYNLFLMRAMAPPEVTIVDIYRSIIPFVAVMIIGLALVMAFPQIALWLPQTVYGN